MIMAACIAGMTSCGTTRYISKADIANVNEAALIAPVAEISFIDREGQVYLDEALSEECRKLLTETMLYSGVPISGVIRTDGDMLSDNCLEAIHAIRSINPKKAGSAPIPEALDKLLEDNGKRYGIVLFAQGFERDAKNFRKEAVKGALLGLVTGIATLGAVTVTNVPSRNTLDTWMAVIDSESDRIVFFNHLVTETSPTTPPQVVRHVEHLTKRLCK